MTDRKVQKSKLFTEKRSFFLHIQQVFGVAFSILIKLT